MQKLLMATVGVLALQFAGMQFALAEAPEWRDWPNGQRLNLSVGAYRPNVSTFLSATDPDNVIQGVIDFESDLGLEDTETVGIAGLKWRISKRNALRFDYFQLDRSGDGTSTVVVTIRPDDEPPVTFPVDTRLQTFIDVDVYNIGYDFSILADEKKNWSVGLGLSWQDFTVGIGNPDDPLQSADADASAPLPTFNTSFSYALSDKWLVDFMLGWLDVDVDLDNSGSFEGRILTWGGAVRWQTFKHVGFELGYSYFDVDVDVDDDDIKGQLEYEYYGPRLGINVYF